MINFHFFKIFTLQDNFIKNHKKLRLYKVKANSLISAIAISLIINLLLTLFLLKIYYTHTENIYYSNYVKAARNIEKTAFYLNHQQSIEDIHFQNIGIDTIYINKTPWLFWDIYSLSHKIISNKYLKEDILCGKTTPDKYKGVVYAPNAAVGLKVLTSIPFKGKVYCNKSCELPPSIGFENIPSQDININNEFKERIRLYKELNWTKLFNNHFYNCVSIKDTINNKNLDSIQIINLDALQLDLSNKSFNNYIILYSNNNIIIPSSFKAKNIIIIGKSIEIKEGFKGCLNILAKDSIVIRKNVELDFPSSIILEDTKVIDNKTKIVVQTNTKINGLIALISNGVIEIDENSIIRGNLYSLGSIKNYGSITGCLYCNKFVFEKSGSINYNVFSVGKYEADINNQYISPFLIGTENKTSTIKWLR